MINLDAPTEEVTPLNLEDTKPALPDSAASIRATKAAYGLDGLVSYDDIYSSIKNNSEESSRAVAAAKVNDRNRQNLSSFILQKGVTPEQINAKFNANPSSVFEDNYADKFLGGFLKYPGASIEDTDTGTFTMAARENPEGTSAVLDLSKDTLAKRELIHSRLIDAVNAQQNESYVGRGVDFLKDISGITSLYTLRGNVPGNFWLESQRQAYSHMPHEDFVNNFNTTMDYLIKNNPSAAITFADYMGDPSYMKDLNDKAFTVLDAATIAQGFTAGAKGLHKVLFQREVKRMADEVLEKVPLADGHAPVEAVAEDAVGHPVKAGEVRMEAETLAGVRGNVNPEEQAKDGITAVLRPTGNIMIESPTNVGAENMNRLRESFTNAGQNVVDVVNRMSRVLRINDVLATREAISHAKQQIVDRYPGTAGNVVNVLPVRFDHITNKFVADVVYMRNDATPFNSIDDALGWADRNSLVVDSIHGMPREFPDITTKTGAAVHEIETRPHPGSYKPLSDILEIAARNPNLSYKEKEGLERLGTAGAGEPIEAKTLKLSTGQTVTSYRPANGAYSQGKGFYIVSTKPLDETDTFFRDLITKTDKALDKNKGWMNQIGLGGWRTGSEVLSVKDMTDRQVAIYGPALLKEVIARIQSPTALARSKLRGNNWYDVIKNWGESSQFQEMMTDAQKMQKDFKDVTELNQYYNTKFKRLPSETEVQGYFSYIQGKKIDYIFRNIALHSAMSRVGGEQLVLAKTLEDGTVSKSKSYVGVMQKEMPNVDDNVLIQGDNGFEVKRLDNLLKVKRGQDLNEGVKKGEWELSKVYDYNNSGLNEFSGENRPIHYVLSKKIEKRPLDFIQIPEKEGGHLEYPYDFYLREAKMQTDVEGAVDPKRANAIRMTEDVIARMKATLDSPDPRLGAVAYRKTLKSDYDRAVASLEKYKNETPAGGFTIHYYNGDSTIMALESRAIGADAKKYIDEFKASWKAGDMDAAKTSARKLGIGWPEIVRKVKSGAMDVNQPTYIVPRGKTIADMDNHFASLNVEGVSKFKDTTHSGSGSLANQFKVEFTGERDAYDVYAAHNEGTIWNPALSYRPADLVDPFTSINRSLTRIADSTYMQDVKIASVEGWIQRAGHLLQATPQELKDNPYRVFNNAEFKRGEVNTAEVRMLEAERYQIKAFAGMPSTLDTWIHSMSQSLADSVYGASNPLKRGSALVAKWSFDKAVSFPSFIRSMAYRADIGLFNPAQLLVQMNSYVTIAGMAGFQKAGQGTFGALLHLYSKSPHVNEGILQGLDKMAQKVGFRPGEWSELRQHLLDSGFEYIGKETQQTLGEANMYPDRIFSSAKGTFLDAGDIFFKGGERFSRYGAWYAGGREWKDLNPTRNLKLSDRNSILNRADDLMGNMTKASRSALQTGTWSMPTQFLGYQLRIMELMFGKRLTTPQKLRMFGVYSAMYGMPIATGLGSIYPFAESIKTYAMTHGYVEGDNVAWDTAFQGAPAVLLQMATGQWLNVGERYGAPSFDVVRDALAGNKSFWQVATGASGNLVFDAWKKADPFVKMAISHIKGENVFDATGADLVNLAKGVATVNKAWQVQTALNSMEWLSRNENPMAKGVSSSMAYFMGVTGLQPLEVSKSQQYYEAHSNMEEMEKTAEKGYILEWRRGLRDLREGNHMGATQHFRNADATLAYYKYPQARRDNLFAQANDRQTLPEKEAWQYWVGGKDIPAGDETYRAGIYSRILRQGAAGPAAAKLP